MSSIQRLYLTLSGFTEVPREKMSQREGFCPLVDEYLDNAFNFFKSSNSRVGFVATWSLSETPLSVRERIFPRFYQVCDQYLIAYQPAWEGVNNVNYFSAFPNFRPELNWLKEDMPRLVPAPQCLFIRLGPIREVFDFLVGRLIREGTPHVDTQTSLRRGWKRPSLPKRSDRFRMGGCHAPARSRPCRTFLRSCRREFR
jgi:hypothetical protein